MVYDIPVALVSAYSERRVIIRSEDPSALVEALPKCNLANLVGVRLLSLMADVDPLAYLGFAIPVELTMSKPSAEFPLLYRHAKLLDKHPIRVSIPVLPGFGKAVKVATSLQFNVKLLINQPEQAAIEEMRAALDFYLHHSSVSQPVEFFHGALSAFYHNHPATLWDVQEEDPAILCYVTDDGVQTVARPDDEGNFLTCDPDDFMANFKEELLAERGECYGCEFFENCAGYFKWPSRSFDCVGVRPLLRTLKEAAVELHRDLNAFEGQRAEVLP